MLKGVGHRRGAGGNAEHGDYFDGNGSTAPCYFFNPEGKVQEFRVCEEVWGPDWCGDWRRPWW